MLSVFKNGTEYQLDDGTLTYLIGDDGWGLSPSHRLSERGPLQHGDTDRGFRLDPRIATLAFHILGTSRNDLYEKRDALMDILAPYDSVLKLRWTTSVTKQIDAFVIGGLEMSSDSRSGFSQRVSVTFKCPDPTFYNPSGKDSTFILGGGSDALEIPMTIPMVVGASTLDVTNVINYVGNWLTYPTIRIVGPIDDPVITNTTIDEKLDFTGLSLGGGEYYDIDLRYGYKTILDNAGVNQIANLTDDSELATWHLKPGNNSIQVTGTSVTEATQVSMSWFDKYVGI